METQIKLCELQAKKAWVFDLDGTLTIAVHDFAYMRRELSMAPDADILATIAALPISEQQRQRVKLDDLEALYAAKATKAIGVLNLISTLAKNGCRLGIFTRNTKAMALLSLQAISLDSYFDSAFIIGRDEALHKPDPQGIQQLLDLWQIAPRDAIMVGDFRFDLEAGRAASVTTVHIAADDRRWPELTDYCFESLDELVDRL